MARTGPKDKITAADYPRVYSALSLGASLRDVAAHLGVDYKTLYNARKKDPEFSKGVNKAIQAGKLHHLKKIRKARQWQASAWYLERRHGKQFGRKDVREVRTKKTVKHEHRHVIDYDQLSEGLMRLAGGGVPANGRAKPVHPGAADRTAGAVPRVAGS